MDNSNTTLAWLNPLEKIAFRAALRDKASEFTSKSGVTVAFDYKRRPGYVWFKTTKGFAPCGWINLG